MAAQRVRVQCINKSDRFNPHERILNIGGINPAGSQSPRWKMSVPDAIRDIKAEKYSFYVERPQNDVVNVVIAKSVAGNEYLKTTADGDQPNNLLSLPECPQ
jgi:Protein of unknown function (DUF3892)